MWLCTKRLNENTYIQIFNWILFSVMALSFASNFTLEWSIFIYQFTSKSGAFNNHDNNVVCWMRLGGIFCNAIKYIKLLHRHCCHATIFRSYYISCQKHKNNNVCFLRAWVTTQNNHCFNVANEWKRAHIHIFSSIFIMFWTPYLHQT